MSATTSQNSLNDALRRKNLAEAQAQELSNQIKNATLGLETQVNKDRLQLESNQLSRVLFWNNQLSQADSPRRFWSYKDRIWLESLANSKLQAGDLLIRDRANDIAERGVNKRFTADLVKSILGLANPISKLGGL